MHGTGLAQCEDDRDPQEHRCGASKDELSPSFAHDHAGDADARDGLITGLVAGECAITPAVRSSSDRRWR